MKVALASIDISWRDKSTTLGICESLLELTKTSQLDMIIFPEMTLTGFASARVCSHLPSPTRAKASFYGYHIGLSTLPPAQDLAAPAPPTGVSYKYFARYSRRLRGQ